MTKTAKITREFFKKKPDVVLRPQTKEDAVLIQKALAKMGVKWAGGQRVGSYVSKCVQNGMLVAQFKLYYFSTPVNPTTATISTADFLTGTNAYDLMSEPEKLRHDFNLLSGKVDRILELLEARQLPTIPTKPRTTGVP